MSSSSEAKQAVYTVDTEDLGPGSEKGVYDYLRLFEDVGIKSTFFTTGHFARSHPAIVKDILAAGHEVGAHADGHPNPSIPVSQWAPFVDEVPLDATRDYLRRNRETLTDLGATAPLGFRAPRFRITQEQFDMLGEFFDFDSSLWHGRTGLVPPSGIRELYISRVRLIDFRLGTPLLFLPFGILAALLLTEILPGSPLVLYGHSYDFLKNECRLYTPMWKQCLYNRRCGPGQYKRVRSFLQSMMNRGFRFDTARNVLYGASRTSN